MSDHSHSHDELEDHDLGLSHDVPQLVAQERKAWGRRGLLGLVGGVGAVALVGCGDDDQASSADSTASESASAQGGPGQPPSGGGAPPQGGMRRRLQRLGRGRRDPRGDRRPLPGRRVERRQRAERERHRAQRPHLVVRLGVRGGRRRAGDGRSSRSTTSTAPTSRRWPARRSTCGTATARAATRCTPRASPTRTTCAASRRPPPTAASSSRRSSRPATTAAGRTCTSRSTSRSTPRPSYSNKLRTSQLAIPEDSCREVYGVVDGYEASVDNFERGHPRHRRRVQRRLLAAARDRDRLGRRGLHVHAQRAGLAPISRVGGCRPPCPKESRRRATAASRTRRSPRSASGRSGSTCTCRSARSAAATATSTPTRSPTSAPRPACPAPPGRRTPAPRSRRSGWPGGCWAAGAGRDRLLRRRHADAAQPGRPRRRPGVRSTASSGWRRAPR